MSWFATPSAKHSVITMAVALNIGTLMFACSSSDGSSGGNGDAKVTDGNVSTVDAGQDALVSLDAKVTSDSSTLDASDDAAVAPPPCSYSPWDKHVVLDSRGSSEIGVDSNGLLHYLTSSGASYTLQYFSGASGTNLQIQALPASGSVVTPFMTVSQLDNVVVRLETDLGEQQDLRIAHKTANGGWSVSDVGASAQRSLQPATASFAQQSDGTLHIVFSDMTTGQILHAYGNGANKWNVQELDTYGSTESASTDLVIDAKGTLHALYELKPDGAVRYASLSPGGAWVKTTLREPNAGEGAVAVAIAVDREENVHALFNELSTGNVRYGVLSQGNTTWALETLMSDNMYVGSVDLALASEGTVHACYATVGKGDPYNRLHCSIKSPASNWETARVDDEGTRQTSSPSLAIDRDNHVHLVYQKVWLQGQTVLGERKYARRRCQ